MAFGCGLNGGLPGILLERALVQVDSSVALQVTTARSLRRGARQDGGAISARGDREVRLSSSAVLPSDHDAWPTDEDLRAAYERFVARIPGYVQPTAYTLARRDAGGLTVGYLNKPGGEHKLPAAVLALVCGYVGRSGVFRLSSDQVAEAIGLLAPAEAAAHWDHPNLWSWRRLLASAEPGSSFLAYFVAPGPEGTSNPTTGQRTSFVDRSAAV